MKLVVGCISFTEGKSETKPTPSLRIQMRALLNIPIQYHQEQTEDEITKERSIRRRHFHTYTHSLYFPLFSCPAVPRNYVTYCTLFIPGGPIKLSEFRTTSDTRSSVSLSLVLSRAGACRHHPGMFFGRFHFYDHRISNCPLAHIYLRIAV